MCKKSRKQGILYKIDSFSKTYHQISTKKDAPSNVLYHVCLDAHKANTLEDFMAQFKENGKAIAKKVQIYFSMHNPTYYK